jgi:hypothetical protein
MNPLERLMLHDYIILGLVLAPAVVLFVLFWGGTGQ